MPYTPDEVAKLISDEILAMMPDWVKLEDAGSSADGYFGASLSFITREFGDVQGVTVMFPLRHVRPPLTEDEARHGTPRSMDETFELFAQTQHGDLDQYAKERLEKSMREFRESLKPNILNIAENLCRMYYSLTVKKQTHEVDFYILKRIVHKMLSLPVFDYRGLELAVETGEIYAMEVMWLLEQQMATLSFNSYGAQVRLTQFGIDVWRYHESKCSVKPTPIILGRSTGE